MIEYFLFYCIDEFVNAKKETTKKQKKNQKKTQKNPNNQTHGSVIIRRTSNPAIVAASFVA